MQINRNLQGRIRFFLFSNCQFDESFSFGEFSVVGMSSTRSKKNPKNNSDNRNVIRKRESDSDRQMRATVKLDSVLDFKYWFREKHTLSH